MEARRGRFANASAAAAAVAPRGRRPASAAPRRRCHRRHLALRRGSRCDPAPPLDARQDRRAAWGQGCRRNFATQTDSAGQQLVAYVVDGKHLVCLNVDADEPALGDEFRRRRRPDPGRHAPSARRRPLARHRPVRPRVRDRCRYRSFPPDARCRVAGCRAGVRGRAGGRVAGGDPTFRRLGGRDTSFPPLRRNRRRKSDEGDR